MKFSNLLRFVKKSGRANSSLALPPKQGSQGISSSTLLRSCNKVTLEVFIDCLLDKEFEKLIINGQPTQEEIQDAWNTIYLEYCSLMGESNYNEVFDLTKKINTVNSQIILVEGIAKHLIFVYDQYLVDILNDMGLKCDLKVQDDQKTTDRKVKAVVSRAKKWLVQTELLQKQLNKIQEKGAKETGGRDYYDEWLLTLSDKRKYAILARDITVYQFCTAIKQELVKATRKAS